MTPDGEGYAVGPPVRPVHSNSSTAISMTYGFSAARLPLAKLHPWRLPVVMTEQSAAYLGKDYAEAERLSLTMAGAAQQAIPPKTVNILENLWQPARSAQKLEEFIRAREHLAKAEKLTDRQRNPREWAEGRAILARNLWYQGRNAEAETLLRELIRAHEKVLGARVYLLENNVSSRVDEIDTLTPLECSNAVRQHAKRPGKVC